MVKNYYNLSPDIVDSIIFIVKRLHRDYHRLCNNINDECIVLGTCLYACNQSGLPTYEHFTVDALVRCLWKSELDEKKMIQVYQVKEMLNDLFADESSIPLSSNIGKRPFLKS
jgi:hypothetical protein